MFNAASCLVYILSFLVIKVANVGLFVVLFYAFIALFHEFIALFYEIHLKKKLLKLYRKSKC